MDVQKFTSGVVGIAVSIIIVTSLAIPVITEATTGMEAGAMKTMLTIVPLLLVVAIVLAVIGMYISRRD